MRIKRFLGAGAVAIALSGALSLPAQAADSFTIAAAGGSGGVSIWCPEGMQVTNPHVTNVDGSPLDPKQRVDTTALGSGSVPNGFAAWIAPYNGSPTPPADIKVTVTCTC
ncbi:hypothetical protein CFP65_6469 [Kitasatospora sp. MMS16-BH015]|uniref:hypothetical protein n=1 Tax=Kitasatospora sp. MMS16-BH015 TaxID=2018025 RepID=UPI000CA372EE|nr:hypothetical protein [Kitasatospora sp. MMS16-BH015]AUG81125.1 hypothetical protein CFP65_6469 [Kitasatospora sp. MMS16-BH015]